MFIFVFFCTFFHLIIDGGHHRWVSIRFPKVRLAVIHKPNWKRNTEKKSVNRFKIQIDPLLKLWTQKRLVYIMVLGSCVCSCWNQLQFIALSFDWCFLMGNVCWQAKCFFYWDRSLWGYDVISGHICSVSFFGLTGFWYFNILSYFNILRSG